MTRLWINYVSYMTDLQVSSWLPMAPASHADIMPGKIMSGGNAMLPTAGVAQGIIAAIDWFTEVSGRAIAWLTLAMMAITCAVVVMRYVLGASAIALQESVVYLHAAVFMLGAAFALKRDGHVRVDILYRRLSPRAQALIDFAGGLLFLIPVCALIFWLSWDYVLNSWTTRETSSESTGLPWVYALKTLMLVMPATLLAQGIAEILRNLLFLLSDAKPSPPGTPAAEADQ